MNIQLNYVTLTTSTKTDRELKNIVDGTAKVYGRGFVLYSVKRLNEKIMLTIVGNIGNIKDYLLTALKEYNNKVEINTTGFNLKSMDLISLEHNDMM